MFITFCIEFLLLNSEKLAFVTCYTVSFSSGRRHITSLTLLARSVKVRR